MKFYLGTHIPSWLFYTYISLFISAITLRKRKGLKPATCDWALDSGGYSELTTHGRWTITPEQYVKEVQRYNREIGRLDWCAIQDWMCEVNVRKKTGLSIQEHQLRTVQSLQDLKQLDPDIKWAPVLQGQRLDDYLRHVDMYNDAGFDLRTFDIVGVGSVCRRQGTQEAHVILQELHRLGLNLHAFGFKLDGLRKSHQFVKSADSLAWSFGARYQPPLPNHTHKNCANCKEFALQWREKVLLAMQTEPTKQLDFFGLMTQPLRTNTREATCQSNH